MAVPPTYTDLGKYVRDVFTKSYGFGLIKLDLKTNHSGLNSSFCCVVVFFFLFCHCTRV
uniref:Uncharacterized protein n=1 Tax=Mus spicilegus TaxID=10103 RepID=A0A8C6GFR0_MUSSI